VRWGIETDTDDAEGKVIATSDVRPDEAAIVAALPAFTGDLMQTPPKFSAIKIAGERAYDLAREGAEVVLEPRPVHIGRLCIVARPDADHVELEAECGKGTYVRALARDLGRVLGTFGHVVALRRTAVGPFAQDTAVSVEQLPQPESGLAGERGPLLPIQAGLSELPAFQITRSDAARLARGQSVIMRGRDAPIVSGCAAASSEGTLIAIVDAEGGELHPRRIFNHRMRH
jgi:tRNA pseudouridine55 synthase